MDALPQEYPCFGTGDFRSPAFVLKNADGSYCADLRFVSCEVCKGKYQIPGLPAVYDETGTESETLKVYLEDAGECYGCMLLYSGNFKAEAEKNQYEQTRLVMGLSDEMFSWRLEPGETFDTPEAVLSYSADGFSALSWNLHRLIRSHICRSAYRDTKRPVLINNWEATYFDFTGLRLSEQRQMVQTDSTSMKHRTQLNRITSQEHSLYMQACQSHAWTTSTVHGRCI